MTATSTPLNSSLEQLRAHPAGLAHLLSKGAWKPRPHLMMICRDVLRAVAGTGPRNLIYTMPPRHGKSELISYWLPIWFLEMNHNCRVVLASYEAEFAKTWGRRVRDTIIENEDKLSVRVSPASAVASGWNTATTDGKNYFTKIGGMVTAGRGGPITGKGADLLIADDLIKNQEEADSDTERESMWAWFNTTFLSRKEPGCITIVVFTRWHSDDIIGRIEAQINDPDYKGTRWKFTNIPALAQENDLLGREAGEALWPERYSEEELREKQADDPAHFECMYQGNPQPAGGTTFKREWFDGDPNHNLVALFPRRNRFDATKADTPLWPLLARYQTWDTALKDKENSAYTVCHTFDLLQGDDTLYKLALRRTFRDKITFDKLPEEITAQAEHWRFAKDGRDILNTILIEEKASGISALQVLAADGDDWLKDRIQAFTPSADKETRAKQIAPWVRRGCILLPLQSTVDRWLWVFEDEFFKFPGSKFKDQVDPFVQLVSYLEHFIGEGYYIRTAAMPKDDEGNVVEDDTAA